MKQLENSHKQTPSSRKHEQIQVVKTFGQRMREAREIANFTQIKAAELLGYSNSSKLAKIEGATDTNSIPLWLIPRAAELYGVSVDFLFGLSGDEWERDPVLAQQRQINRWVFDIWEQTKAAEVNAIRVLYNKFTTIEKAVSHSVSRSKENLSTLDKMRELNPKFDDMKMGAKLLRLLIETAEEAAGISNDLKRYKCLMDVAKKSENINLDVFSDL